MPASDDPSSSSPVPAQPADGDQRLADESEQARVLCRAEYLRMSCSRPIAEAVSGSGLCLVVALQVFGASDFEKGLLAGGPFWGLLLTPVVVALVTAWGLTVSCAIAGLMALAALGLMLAIISSGAGLFVAGAVIAGMSGMAIVPLVTALWRQQAPERLRGSLFAKANMVSMVVALGCGLGVSWYIGDEAGKYRGILICFIAMLLVAMVAMLRLPSKALDGPRRRNPYACLNLLWKDRLFGYVCFVWMLMGLGNLATMPMRVELLGSAERGQAMSAGMIILLLQVLPELCSFIATFFWGRLFDRINFMVLRICINIFFIISMVAFFGGFGMPGIVIGSLAWGIARGGGTVAWSLWVTKFSPPERTADYMAVHGFLTGTRGLLGPLLAYQLLFLGWLSIEQIGWGGALLCTVSTLLTIPIIRYGRR